MSDKAMSKRQLVMIVRKTAVFLAAFSLMLVWIALMLSGIAGAIAGMLLLLVVLAVFFATLDVMGQP